MNYFSYLVKLQLAFPFKLVITHYPGWKIVSVSKFFSVAYWLKFCNPDRWRMQLVIPKYAAAPLKRLSAGLVVH